MNVVPIAYPSNFPEYLSLDSPIESIPALWGLETDPYFEINLDDFPEPNVKIEVSEPNRDLKTKQVVKHRKTPYKNTHPLAGKKLTLVDLKPFVPKKTYEQLEKLKDKKELNGVVYTVYELVNRVRVSKTSKKIKAILPFFLKFGLFRTDKSARLFNVHERSIFRYIDNINKDKLIIDITYRTNQKCYYFLKDHNYDMSLLGKKQRKKLQDHLNKVSSTLPPPSIRKRDRSPDNTSPPQKKQKTGDATFEICNSHQLKDDPLFSILFTACPIKEVQLPPKYVSYIRTQSQEKQEEAKAIFKSTKYIHAWIEQSQGIKRFNRPIKEITEVALHYLKIIPLKQKELMGIYQSKSHSTIKTWINEINTYQNEYQIIQVSADNSRENIFYVIKGYQYDRNFLSLAQITALHKIKQ